MFFNAWHSIASYPHVILTGYPFMDGTYINCSLAKPIQIPINIPCNSDVQCPATHLHGCQKKFVHPHEIPGKSPLLMGKTNPKWCV